MNLIRIKNLHRRGLDFELLREPGGPRRFEHIPAGKTKDLAIDPNDPELISHERAGLIRIGSGAPAPAKREPLQAPPVALIKKAAARRRKRKGQANG